MRREVKERCAAMVSAEYMAINLPNKIAELAAMETRDYNYIYPVAKVSYSICYDTR